MDLGRQGYVMSFTATPIVGSLNYQVDHVGSKGNITPVREMSLGVLATWARQQDEIVTILLPTDMDPIALIDLRSYEQEAHV